ncbi:MAG TPA: primosomal protein N' [Micropepsaceae bacterium]|jgi:primosomal protein N' (replication factor Y)|nr:primosomal protein N' [Micropepsaceae bacterium]
MNEGKRVQAQASIVVPSRVESRAAVLLPLPLPQAYDYALPEGIVPKRGLIVRAPLGARELIGVVWGKSEGGIAAEKVRLAVPMGDFRLPPMLCDFIDWVARYTLSPPGAVLAQALRARGVFDPEVPRKALQIGAAVPARMNAARERVLALMADGLARIPAEIADLAAVSPGVVKSLADLAALKWVSLPEFAPCPEPDAAFDAVKLSPDQLRAAEHLRDAVKKREFSVALLDGVTGSGKTEAYFEAVAEALSEGRQALILLPEIALTVQFLDRFEARFGCRPVEWHSDLSMRERKRAYRAVMTGEARVVVGARSALFLPFAKLGLIVVDEEHEHAYKQEEGVIYHARDMAVVRARLENCAIVLASATPSLETYVNAKTGRYEWLRLAHRHGVAEMPEVRLVDMRIDHGEPGQYLSPPLRAALDTTLRAGEQALLFLNRRGYAPLTLCTVCGRKETCRNCSAWMVEHRYRRRLVCHHCAYEIAIPQICAQCGAEHSYVACGPGVERVEEEFRAAFPDARVAVASSDTLLGPAQTQRAIRAFADGEIDVIIGTQIVAKGHHFPQLTLAGIIDADLGGGAGDPRSAERSFQLLHQVAGRSGRGDRPGLVLIQTRNPEDPVMQALASQARDDFLEEEIRLRQRSLVPPFGRLASLILAGEDAVAVRETGRELASTAPRAQGVAVWGPAPAFYQVLRGRTRERLLVQAEKSVDVQGYIRTWLGAVKIPSAVRLTVDIDPISFF